MGVVRRSTAGRWAAAIGGTIAVALVPAGVAAFSADGSGRDERAIIGAALDSAAVPHQGLVETTGTLGLPDLPRLGTLAALAGSTTRARVWWRSADRWRVDEVTPTGERGTYAIGGVLHTWDFESQEVGTVVGASPVRLPRVDDLLPPQLARRVLAGATAADRLTSLGPQRVAGRPADGLRLVPAAANSTVGRIDLWVDVETSLPLQVEVYARGARVPAATTRFVEVDPRRPSDGALTPKTPPGARQTSTSVPDIVSSIDLYAPYILPRRLGNVGRSDAVLGLGGSATYGKGFAQFVVLPLPPRLAHSSYDAAVAAGSLQVAVTGGDGAAVSTSLLNGLIVHAGTFDHGRDGRGPSYLLAGTVDQPTLQAGAEALFADPPPEQ